MIKSEAKKNTGNVLRALSLVLLLFLIHLPFCGLGIDLEDAGLHLLFSHNAYTKEGFTWLSCPLTNWLCGFWMSFAPCPRMVWWGYLGGVITYSVFAFFCILIYFELFKIRERKEYGILLCALLASQPDFGRSLLHYYSFPVTLTVAFFYFWIKSEKSNRKNIAYFCLGIGGVLLVLSRFSFVTILSLPILFFSICFYREKEFRKEILKQGIFFVLGILVGFALSLPVYRSWASDFSQFSQGSEISVANIFYRLRCFFRDMFVLVHNKLPQSIGFITIVYFFNTMCVKKSKTFAFNRLLVIATFLYVSHALYQYYKMDQCYSYYGTHLTELVFFRVIPFALCFCLFMLFPFSGFCKEFDDIFQYHFFLIVLMLFAASLLVPFGSDVYLSKIGYLLPLILMIAGGCIYRKTCPGIYFSIWMCVIILTVGAHLSYGYLNPIPFRCDTESTIPALKFMKTSRQRQRVIDESFRQIERKTKGEKEILLFSHTHFLPLYVAGLQNWVGTGTVGTTALVSRIKIKMKTHPLPNFVLVEGGIEKENIFKTEISQEYKCVFRSEDLIDGKNQNFLFSLYQKKQ